MPPWQILLRPLDSPTQSLLTIFVVWKSILLLVAVSSPGVGYDTSTSLYNGSQSPQENFFPAVLSLVSTKLTRWDAIYFTKAANRNYLYEQEWAFGWGMTRLIRFFAKDLRDIGFKYDFVESVVGITISHASHGASVLMLHTLGKAIFVQESGRRIAFIAACLHIFSPGGLFLSAPCGESTFSFLALLGCLCFVQSFRLTGPLKDLSLLGSGVVFGLATTVRTNGLLYGILFLEEACGLLYSFKDGMSLATIRRLAASGAGGVCIAFGFLLPQYIAYQELCGVDPAVWCTRIFPSVYTYVQEQYWNVGFLRYWTLSNIPLFLLAAPMLAILSLSSLWTLETPTGAMAPASPLNWRLLRSLAVPQSLLAALALTTYHVQIITRISSGYPIWYFWIAAQLIDFKRSATSEHVGSLKTQTGQGMAVSIVRYIVIYAIFQGGLYASFLPPA